MKWWKCSNKYYSLQIILTPPIEVYLSTNVRKNFVPNKFWQILKLSPPIIMGEGGAETMKWYKVWRKTDSWFQKQHEEFGEFSPNHLKVPKFHFDTLFLSKVYEVWAKKIQSSYLAWHWTVMQNLNKPWPSNLKNGMRNWVNWEGGRGRRMHFDGLLLSKA